MRPQFDLYYSYYRNLPYSIEPNAKFSQKGHRQSKTRGKARKGNE